MSAYSCPVMENFIWFEPLLRGHLSYNANKYLSLIEAILMMGIKTVIFQGEIIMWSVRFLSSSQDF
jgi:hypothetical protein